MAHERKEAEFHGLRLWLRFSLLMTFALAVVMAIAGYWLYSRASAVAEKAQEAIMVESVKLTGQFAHLQADIERLEAERTGLIAAANEFDRLGGRLDPEVLAIRDAIHALRDQKSTQLVKAQDALEAYWKKVGVEETGFGDGRTFRYPVSYGENEARGFLYRYTGQDQKKYELLVPAGVDTAQKGLLKIIVVSTVLVVLVGAGMSVFVASTVSRPIIEIVRDIQQISKGVLSHHSKTGQSGEVGQLALAINRMAKSLADARETEVELSIRDREVALAGEVRDALLPQEPPRLAGYDIGALHIASQDLGGDFQDFIQFDDGRLGLLVCDVSGKGVPGALVGAMARSYLRSELMHTSDVKQAFHAINREIARDIRRGMFVTALYVLVDPARHLTTAVCAGHKIPLLRYTKSDGKLRLIQPEGIALGFDKGPVFERRLDVHHVVLESGDRLVLCNTGTVAVANPDGAELGERPLFTLIHKQAPNPSEEFLAQLRAALEAHAAGTPFPQDISIVTIARN